MHTNRETEIGKEKLNETKRPKIQICPLDVAIRITTVNTINKAAVHHIDKQPIHTTHARHNSFYRIYRTTHTKYTVQSVVNRVENRLQPSNTISLIERREITKNRWIHSIAVLSMWLCVAVYAFLVVSLQSVIHLYGRKKNTTTMRLYCTTKHTLNWLLFVIFIIE